MCVGLNNRYLNFSFYLIVTMSTVGYGDITPESSIEILWGLFAILVSCCMFAYCINTIGMIFNEFSKK